MDGWMGGCVGEWMNGVQIWMIGWMDKWMDRWVDGWVGE